MHCLLHPYPRLKIIGCPWRYRLICIIHLHAFIHFLQRRLILDVITEFLD
nr:hypothetical protein Iba_chr02dCG9490 [Ipomoea batatas]